MMSQSWGNLVAPPEVLQISPGELGLSSCARLTGAVLCVVSALEGLPSPLQRLSQTGPPEIPTTSNSPLLMIRRVLLSWPLG